MPLTAKGEEILSAMKQEYGAEKGEEVFYASKNAGTITGVDNEQEHAGDSVLPSKVTAAQINEQNRQFWYQGTPEGAKELDTNPPKRI